MLFKSLLLLIFAVFCSPLAYGQITINGVVTSVTCSGESNGAIDIEVSGGVLPYLYEWNNGASTEDIVDLAAGTYLVKVTDKDGASEVATFVIYEPAPLQIAGTVIDQGCSNSGGSIELSISGGTAPYRFRWSNGATTPYITNLQPGIYTIEIIDDNYCQTYREFEVKQVENTLALSAAVMPPDCENNNGAIDLYVTGGQGPNYQFEWSNGETSRNLTGLSAGTYSVTVFDEYGCSASIFVELQASSLEIHFASVPNNSCDPTLANGSIETYISGGVAPYTYRWLDGETTANRSGLAAGTYSLMVVDDAGCSVTAEITVADESHSPVITAVSTTAQTTCSGGGDGTASVNGISYAGVAERLSEYRFRWTDASGYIIQEGNSATISNLAAGIYYVSATRLWSPGAGCSSVPMEVVVPYEPIMSDIMLGSSPNDACDTNYNGVIISEILVYDLDSYNYTLVNDERQVIAAGTGEARPLLYFNGLPGGTYELEIILNTGCVIQDVVIVDDAIEPPMIMSLISTEQTDCGYGNGTASVTDIYPDDNLNGYIYHWTDAAGNAIPGNSPTITNLIAGTYYVTATKNNGNPFSGCTSEPMEVVVLFSPAYPAISLSSTPNEACNTNYSGTLTATITSAVPSYTWSWFNAENQVIASGNETASANLTGLVAGDYMLRVVAGNGCPATASITLTTENPAYSIAYEMGHVQCAGEANGWINVTTQPDFDYYWYQDGAALTTDNPEALAALAPGTYQLKAIHRDLGCEYLAEIGISEPAPLQITEAIQQLSAFGANDGSIQLAVAGGTPPYRYQWSNGESSAEISALSPETYSVIVTDAQNCSQERVFAIAPLSLADAQQEGSWLISRTWDNQLLVEFVDMPHAEELKVYRLDGRLSATAAVNGAHQITLSLPQGGPALYLVVLTSGGKMHKKKIIF